MFEMQSTPIPSETDTGEGLLAKANLYGFFAVFLAGPFDPASYDDSAADLVLLSARRCGGGVVSAVARLLAHARHANAEEYRAAWAQTFGRLAAAEMPPYSARYGSAPQLDAFREAQTLADVVGYYRAFGVQLAQGTRDRPDHATPELEFLTLLCAREAAARSAGLTEKADTVCRARMTFLRDHAGPFAFGWSELCERRPTPALYRALAVALRALVATEFRAFGLAVPAPVVARLADEVVSDTAESPEEGTSP